MTVADSPTMVRLECLACGHDNKSGEELCSACGSSLDLKLCAGCEAINGGGAEACHACGSRFDVTLSESPTAVSDVALATSVPATRPLHANRAGASRALRLAVLILPAMFGGAVLAYYGYGKFVAGRSETVLVSAPRTENRSEARSSPRSSVAGAVQPVATAVSPSPSEGDPASGPRPDKTNPAVTHTRRIAASPIAGVREAAKEKSAAALATVEPGRNEPLTQPRQPAPRVTHTKATIAPVLSNPEGEPGIAAAATAPAAPAEYSAGFEKNKPGCTQAMAVLAFCSGTE